MDMFILLKKHIITSLVLLLFITEGTYLHASELQFHRNEKSVANDFIYSIKLSTYTSSVFGFSFSEDTVLTNNSDIDQKKTALENNFNVPENLAKMPINFRINSAINYLSFSNFIRNDSKKIFYEAWLKEKELQRIDRMLDSLRKVYAIAPSEKKEEISKQILQSEKSSIALNEEIPSIFQKARDEENQYWQNASTDEIAKFQEKIRIYKDSVTLAAEKKSQQLANAQHEIPDTLIFYNMAPAVVEKSATEPSPANGIIYKIQIGAYKGKIPESANKLIKKLSIIRKVDNYIDAKGVKIYTTGNLKLYKEAETLQNQVKQEGVRNAVITAYKNGEKISVNEARKLNNEL